MSLLSGPVATANWTFTTASTIATSSIRPIAAYPTSGSSNSTTVDTLFKLCLLWSVLNKHEDSYKKRVSLYGGDFMADLPPKVCHEFFHFRTSTSSSNVRQDRDRGPEDVEEDDEEDDDDEFFRVVNDGARVIDEKLRKSKYTFKYSSRSLSVIGALGGIVFILFVVALSTCIKHRRELYLRESRDAALRGHEAATGGGYSREILLGHIRHIRAAASARSSSFRSNASSSHRSSVDPPPCYDDVVKGAFPGHPQEPQLPAHCSAEEDDAAQLPSYHEAMTASWTVPVAPPDLTAQGDVVITMPSYSLHPSGPDEYPHEK